MNNTWKYVIAAGAVALVWFLTRSSSEDDGGYSAPSSSPEPQRPSPSPAASSGGESSGGSAAPETDGGVVRDGRMRGGTWNFAPAEAADDAPGCLVLRDVPKSSITVDGEVVELRGGFRGFREVPAGAHKLELEGYGGHKVAYDLDMPKGGCIVLIYEDTNGPPRLEPDRDWGPQYIGLAMGGAMGQALWPWPGGEKESA